MAKRCSGSSTGELALVMALVLVAMSSRVVKQTEAACPAVDLDPCLPAAVADVQPSAECCSNLSTYTSTNDGANDLACLCEAAMGSAFLTSNPVDFAKDIPQKCNLKYAAGTQCDGVVIPGGQ